MKIIQSLWTKPAINTSTNWDGDLKRGETGGWLTKKTYFQSLALSCLRLRNYYDNVELITDTIGNDILISQLKLPYTSVKLSLNDISNEHQDLWALGKIYAYSLQTEPFLHVDGDVYIWGQFPKLKESQLLVQNLETHLYYNQIVAKYQALFKYFPDCLKNLVELRKSIWCVNAGILGGNDYSFIQKYAQEAITFVNYNRQHFSQIGLVEFNLIFEQIFFFHLARENSKTITTMFKGVYPNYDDWIVNFKDAHSTTKYVHAIGKYKQSQEINILVADYLLKDFPKYYYRIEDLFV